MKNTFYLFVAYCIVDCLFVSIMLDNVIESFKNHNIGFLLLWSIILFSNLNVIMNKYRNFKLYYPHFEDKWLYFI